MSTVTIQSLMSSAMGIDYSSPVQVFKASDKAPKVKRQCEICSGSSHSWKNCYSRCSAACSSPHSDKDCPERICFRCQEKGHFKADCPNKTLGPKCHECGERGHIKSRCIQRIKCHLCDKKGHLKQDCPVRCWSCDVKVPHSIYLCKAECKYCGEKGHIAKYCSSPYIWTNKFKKDQGRSATSTCSSSASGLVIESLRDSQGLAA